MRVKRGQPDPETRVGNCCGCNRDPVLLFKAPDIFRYRCDPCFEKERGYRHHLAPTRIYHVAEGSPVTTLHAEGVTQETTTLRALLFEEADIKARDDTSMTFSSIFHRVKVHRDHIRIEELNRS